MKLSRHRRNPLEGLMVRFEVATTIYIYIYIYTLKPKFGDLDSQILCKDLQNPKPTTLSSIGFRV